MDQDIYNRPVELLQRLIRFNTTNPPGNERVCIEWIDGLIKNAGIETQIFSKEPDRPNLIARLEGEGKAPPLLLYGHVDVVAAGNQIWAHDPFAAAIESGYLWGRGAADMKGGVAMMLSAFLRAKHENYTPPGDILFLALSDEEVGGALGAKYMVEEHPELFEGVKYAIGEFGGYNMEFAGKTFYPIQVSEKQGCGLKVTVRGPGGHGSMLHRGGTLSKLSEILSSLDRNFLPVHITPPVRQLLESLVPHLSFPQNLWLKLLLNPLTTDWALARLGEESKRFAPLVRNTINITLLNGGNAVNVLPSEVTMNADVRILPGFSPEDAIAEIRQVIGDEVDLEVVYSSPNPISEPDMALFPVLSQIINEIDPLGIPIPFFMAGVTDARFFARLGIQTYGFTPMRLPQGLDFTEVIHAANERIGIESVEQGAEAIYKVLQRFGG